MKLNKKSFTTVTPFSKFIALLMLVLLPFIGFYFGMKFEQTRDAESKMQWQKYEDPNGYFSFEYPSNWRIDYIGHAQDDPYSSVEFKKVKDLQIRSIEGSFDLHWVESYGGGCDGGYEKIMLKKEEFSVCHHVSEESEIWWQIGRRFEEGKDLGFQIDATAEKPVEINREIVLRMLKSFEVHKQ